MRQQCGLGVTLPFEDVSLDGHRPLLRTLVEAGYSEVWTGEVAGNDGFSPLALWVGWEKDLSISCAVASVFTRGPGILAMTAATLAEVAPGRCRFGIGAGSAVIAEDWNGTPFVHPYRKVADTLRFLRQVLSGERADDFPTVHAKGFKLSRRIDDVPKLLVAALGPRMQDLAAAEADGVVLNFLSAADVAKIRARCDEVERVVDSDFEISARIFVVPGNSDAAESAARRHMAGYLTIDVYARFQDWLGRGPELAAMAEAWAAGDRKRAVREIEERTVRDLFVFGTPQECARAVDAYFEAGVDAATLYILPTQDPLSPEARVNFLAELAGNLTPRT
jgi:probable F420-dependent oxidoreductase